ncbi:ornithine carbamoyltransferase [Metabacillus sp. KIGAM252]|uniref:Ornithine carbamoyltransferase n=1 Tax=Metabacillus flavus TaxID=2823519 RepID=A0ABS5LCA9_9BACI|nr:ornithine carbamoyltransferase [Metabacillus flavus]MBS2968365.1 ornithine carbamoyltransferase [Metabacillus flavus]
MHALTNEQQSLKGQDFLTLLELDTDIIHALLDEAAALKKAPIESSLKGKMLAMIFEKSSTRTRVSFEAGMLQLGGHALFLSSSDLQLGRGETIADTAKVLSAYVDAIMIRTFEHEKAAELAAHASVPVINGLTDLFHPCQALADLLTIQELKGSFIGKKIVYIGDGNNVAHSLMIACAKMGMDFALAAPKGYEADASVINEAKKISSSTGSKLEFTSPPREAAAGADILYSDVWTSMGQEGESLKRLKDFEGFQVNAELMKHAKPDAHFLHCLPAHREEEVTSEVIDGPQSAVFQQAENRLHAQKALLKMILC